MNVAAEAEFYNQSYSNLDSTALLPASESPLAPLYYEVRRWLPASAIVHDLGCGTGQLGEILFQNSLGGYRGIDFSEVAIKEAHKRLSRYERALWELELADLRDWQQPDNVYNAVFVCTETLEHLEDDLGLLRKIQPGRRVIFSVPSYDSASHVRWFPNLSDVWERYQPNVTINRWSRIEVGSAGGCIHLLDTIRRGDNW